EAAKFVGDFKSIAKESNDSLAKHKALELEIERLLKAVVSQDIMIIVQNELQSNIYKNAKLRTQLFKKVSDQKDNTKNSSENTKFAKQPIVKHLPKVGMFRINPSKTSREEKHVPNTLSASARTKPITVTQPPVNTKKDVNSDLNGLSSARIDNTKTRRPQPRSNTKNDRNVNGKNSCGKNHKAKVSVKEIQKKYQPKVAKPKKIGTHESLATPKPRKPRFLLRWSPTGRLFDQEGKLTASSNSKSQYDCSNGDNACTSKDMEPKIKRFLNSTSLLDRNLEGVDLLKGDRSTNLYTINIHEMASASSICLMARASSIKSWLWHQRLSHLNFDTINDLARNDLVAGLPNFKYHKEHLCPSCEVYNRQTKKIMETMNVSFDELSAMAFEQSSSKPGLNNMTFGHISSGLDLTYAPSTITTQQPSEGEL
nr:integrase, catalytic region, zinc finger, CCHC-type, peptidase aspartic, catalytic [Tanacetum cinerariifolium]